MGVEGLSSFLRKRAPDAFTIVDRSKYRGKRLVFDISVWIYTYLRQAHRRAVRGVKVDTRGRYKEVVKSIFRMVESCLAEGVTPIFVFDGQPPPEKELTLAKRRDEKRDRQNKVNEVIRKWEETPAVERTRGQLAEVEKMLQSNCSLPPEDVENIRDFFTKLGVPCLRSLVQADDLCASLAIEGYASAVVSTDSDFLVYGVPHLITKWMYEFAGDKQVVRLEEVSRSEVLSTLEIDHDQFVGMILLMGSDYNEGVNGVGPVKALERVKNSRLPSRLNDYDTKHLRSLFEYRLSTSLTEDEIRLTFDSAELTRNIGECLAFLGYGSSHVRYVCELCDSLPVPPSSYVSVPPRRVKLQPQSSE